MLREGPCQALSLPNPLCGPTRARPARPAERGALFAGSAGSARLQPAGLGDAAALPARCGRRPPSGLGRCPLCSGRAAPLLGPRGRSAHATASQPRSWPRAPGAQATRPHVRRGLACEARPAAAPADSCADGGASLAASCSPRSEPGGHCPARSRGRSRCSREPAPLPLTSRGFLQRYFLRTVSLSVPLFFFFFC